MVREADRVALAIAEGVDGLIQEAESREVFAREQRIAMIKPRFLAGLSIDELLLVKGPFPTPGGGNEWMCVEGTTLRGVLQNPPFETSDLKAGAAVAVEESDVFECIFQRADGTREGNETARPLQRR